MRRSWPTGVGVAVQGTKNATTTDFDGGFILNNVDPKSTLIFSYIGYKTVSLQADTKSVMVVNMVNDLEKLNEVVVIGYGTSKRKRCKWCYFFHQSI
ncbi:carboxypeptidase-like regulatory domain-containing protein [Flavobacterium ginsengisoli]|uniref:carboxypeptidase-like regulatory domain-containing protein n=1 Tax=Flavobacterium ginsengisoli TaxID=871694 RepID=UPI0024152D81|nr:carboxypeptidase-like regulatory domain-containing protein [Flavobacterium ginsengisoli]